MVWLGSVTAAQRPQQRVPHRPLRSYTFGHVYEHAPAGPNISSRSGRLRRPTLQAATLPRLWCWTRTTLELRDSRQLTTAAPVRKQPDLQGCGADQMLDW
jgi:hypothetical protein